MNQLMKNYLIFERLYISYNKFNKFEESELKLVLISRRISILSWNKIKRSSFF